MSQTAAAEQKNTSKRWGARSITSLILFVLATVLLIPTLLGHWGQRTVIDSERYLATVGPLIEQPAVQEALTQAVTDAVIAKADTANQVDTLLGNLFPNAPIAEQLSAPIAAGINSLIGELVARFVASDQFATVWIQLNEAAQKGVVLILEGKDGGVVRLDGDNLVLDTSVALQSIQKYLVDSGITAAGNITIPDSDREIVLANTPALAQIRFIYSLTSPILTWLPLVVAAMFGAAVLLARRRARTTVAAGIVLLASGVAILIGLGTGEGVFTNQLAGTPWGPAASVFWDSLLDYLIAGTQAIVTLGIVVLLAGTFGGRTAVARRLRGHVTAGLGQLSERFLDGRPGPLSSASAQYLRWVSYALGVVLVLFAGVLSVSSVVWISALVAGLVTLIQLLSGPGASGTVTRTPTPDESIITS